MTLSDGGGWSEVAAGCRAVVVVGVVGGAGVGSGGGAGGVVVVTRAGAAGAGRRADRGFGASTVTCGTEIAGGSPVDGVSGCAGC
jgi:hypothetical protein